MKRLDKRVAELAGFEKTFAVTGQTYPRKIDCDIISALSSLGSTLHKVKLVIINLKLIQSK